MGCKHSSLYHASSVVPTDFLNDFLWNLVDTKNYPTDNNEELPALLSDLERFIIKNYPEMEYGPIISYFTTLSNKTDAYQFFNTAANIMIKMNKSWCLNDESLTFFSQLSQHNRVLYNSLLDELSLLCTDNLLSLNTTHIDTVIASLLRHINLPEDPFTLLDTINDIAPTLQTLREIHGPTLGQTAHHNLLIHHDIPHALEIRLRTMHILSSKINLFIEDIPRNRFLDSVISFIIEFHDYVQGKKGPFNSVELATAHHISHWITDALHLEPEDPLIKIIGFMADQIIVLGTTMIFSPKKTMDLSQLYFMFKDKAIEATMLSSMGPSKEFAKRIEICMLITGVSDKNPTAMDAVVQYQLNDKAVASLPLLRNYFTDTLMLDHFFNQPSFTSYSHNPLAITASDTQSFLINLVPHLGMRAELGVKSKLEAVSTASQTYINFILQCRHMLLIFVDSSFTRYYIEEFTKQKMDEIIATLFFSDAAITGEISFSKSQTGSLEFVTNKLRLLAPPGLEDNYAMLIDPTVPETDALNFHAIKVFYDSLNTSDQAQLVSELLLIAVMQAGNTYAQQPSLDYSKIGTRDTESTDTPVATTTTYGGLFHRRASELVPLKTATKTNTTPIWM
jgi:hypothetical protein